VCDANRDVSIRHESDECTVLQVFAPVLGLATDPVQLNPGGCCSWLIASLVAGWLAGALTRGRGFGCFGDILLGVIGAVVGVFLLSLLNVQFSGQLGFFGTMAVAFVGAFVLALLGRLVGGDRQQPNPYRDWPH
jgi:uncharacterized membrane protein YeaQ/YmgE (transglycosylase-associated protein family)